MKPVLLTFDGRFSSNHKDKPCFVLDTSTRYDFIFVPIDSSISPFITTNTILEKLKKDKRKVNGVLAFSDIQSIVASLIAEKLGLTGPKPESLYRSLQKEVFNNMLVNVNSHQPETYIINLKNTKELPPVSYPAFLRTIRAAGSRYAYMIKSSEELIKLCKKLKNTKRPDLIYYDHFFNLFESLPRKTEDYYLLQAFIVGKQYTVDGYLYKGKLGIFGYTETIYSDNRQSFVRFDFPAHLSDSKRADIEMMLGKIIESTGYDNGGFNVEFFIRPDGSVIIIEFNARISGQFIPLFDQYYEGTVVDVLCKIALGQTPVLIKKNKPLCASSFPLRVWNDHFIRMVPTKQHLDELKKMPGVLGIDIPIKAGKRLSEYSNDVYSYKYGVVDIAGCDLPEILARFNYLKDNLGVVFD